MSTLKKSLIIAVLSLNLVIASAADPTGNLRRASGERDLTVQSQTERPGGAHTIQQDGDDYH